MLDIIWSDVVLEDGEAAFIGRTVLIHEYRRILLHDPDVPEALLPADWPGTQARKRCARIYLSLCKAADRWAVARCEDTGSSLGQPGKGYLKRFNR